MIGSVAASSQLERLKRVERLRLRQELRQLRCAAFLELLPAEAVEVHADDSYGMGPTVALGEFRGQYAQLARVKSFTVHQVGST